MIKAIETIYNGYRFRSRLEARWAVFFDALGIVYEYEPEGYDLDGTWYLPDFWLPQVSMYAEVKAKAFTESEREKCEQLAKGTRDGVLMLDGPPNTRNYWGWEYYSGDVGLTDYSLQEGHEYWLHEERFFVCTGALDGAIAGHFGHPVGCLCDFCDLRGAVRAARRARF